MSTADYRAVIDVVGSRPRFLQRWENEPDLHLIKQVEQVGRTGRRFARIRRTGNQGTK
jgi:hypothetical protein